MTDNYATKEDLREVADAVRSIWQMNKQLLPVMDGILGITDELLRSLDTNITLLGKIVTSKSINFSADELKEMLEVIREANDRKNELREKLRGVK